MTKTTLQAVISVWLCPSCS